MHTLRIVGGWCRSGWMVGLVLLGLRVTAEPHRATRLGDPAHRFAKPLQTKDDLRRLFADSSLRADVVEILNQAKWKGDPEDLRRAAATGEVVAVKLPTGTRLPFMSSRNKGKPVTLIDVIWAGKDPIDAYEFEFASKGWRYRCVTPKACANFLVVELGPEKALRLARKTPHAASSCEPFDVTLEVKNTGGVTLTGVIVDEELPACMKAADGRASVRFEAGTLRPGESRAFGYRAQVSSGENCGGRARARSAEGVETEAESTVKVLEPRLELECRAPSDVLAGRPVELCVRLANAGVAKEPKATLVVPVPAGVTVGRVTDGGVTADGAVRWEFGDLGPGMERTVCVNFVAREPTDLVLKAGAFGQCAAPLTTECRASVRGIPAILLEVVDLEDPVQVGEQVTYEVRVTNQGSLTGTKLGWVATLAEGQEYVSGSGPTGVEGSGREAKAALLDSLEPKVEVVWRVVVKATASADARFKVALTSDQFPRPVEEWEATSQY